MHRRDGVEVSIQRIWRYVGENHAHTARLLDGEALVYTSVCSSVAEHDLASDSRLVEDRSSAIIDGSKAKPNRSWISAGQTGISGADERSRPDRSGE